MKLREGNFFQRCLSVRRGGLGLCPGGSLFRVSLSKGSLSRGISVRGSLSRGSLSRGVFVQGCLCQGDPPCGNERAVRILLECILVFTTNHEEADSGWFWISTSTRVCKNQHVLLNQFTDGELVQYKSFRMLLMLTRTRIKYFSVADPGFMLNVLKKDHKI